MGSVVKMLAVLQLVVLGSDESFLSNQNENQNM